MTQVKVGTETMAGIFTMGSVCAGITPPLPHADPSEVAICARGQTELDAVRQLAPDRCHAIVADLSTEKGVKDAWTGTRSSVTFMEKVAAKGQPVH